MRVILHFGLATLLALLYVIQFSKGDTRHSKRHIDPFDEKWDAHLEKIDKEQRNLNIARVLMAQRKRLEGTPWEVKYNANIGRYVYMNQETGETRGRMPNINKHRYHSDASTDDFGNAGMPIDQNIQNIQKSDISNEHLQKSDSQANQLQKSDSQANQLHESKQPVIHSEKNSNSLNDSAHQQPPEKKQETIQKQSLENHHKLNLLPNTDSDLTIQVFANPSMIHKALQMGVPVGLATSKMETIHPIVFDATLPLIKKTVPVTVKDFKIRDIKAAPAWINLNHGYMSVGTRKLQVKVEANVDSSYTKGSIIIDADASISSDVSFGINQGDRLLYIRLSNTQIQILNFKVSYSKGLAHWMANQALRAYKTRIHQLVSEKMKEAAEREVPDIFWSIVKPQFSKLVSEPLYDYTLSYRFLEEPLISPAGIHAKLKADVTFHLTGVKEKDYLIS